MEKVKLFGLIAATMFFAVILTSCGGGLSGTYVPKNEAAKEMPLTKIVFDGGTVKIYMGVPSLAGMPQIDLGTAIEVRYKLAGDKLIIEGGIPGINGQSIEFQYDKDCNDISLLKGAFGTEGAVWHKEGTNSCDGMDTRQADLPAERESDKSNNSYGFNQELAERLALYSKWAYGDGQEKKECEITYNKINSLLKQDGYIDIVNYSNERENGIGCTLAYQKDRNELVVVVRGTKWEEWKGNMNIGKETERHESFQQANESLQQTINNYIDTYKLDNINFLVTGHSRGAAVANLLAVDLNNMTFIKNAKTKNIYAYTFATPNNRKDFNDKVYNNIFNFCLDDDFVTRIPLDTTFSNWGYGKSGKTYRAVATGLYIINDNFRNLENGTFTNPYFNLYAVETLLQDVHKIVPTISDYYNKELTMGQQAIIEKLPTLNISQYISKSIALGILENPIPLHIFMKNYVAQATIDSDNGKTWWNCTAIPGLGLKAACPQGNDVHAIADFFVDIENFEAEKYIMDTHSPETYINALKSNGFLTK